MRSSVENMSKLEAVERVLSAALSLATIVGVGVLVAGRLSPAAGGMRTEPIADWSSLSEASVVKLSDSTGGVRVVTFTDFECPVCRMSDSILSSLSRRYPGRISRSVIHFPLAGHTNSMPAAVAFECAAVQGRASEMHERLFSSARIFAMQPWTALAREAGVPDSTKYVECLKSKESTTRPLKGLELGSRLKITGTPAFVINGKLFDSAPLPVIESEIVHAVNSLTSTRN
jgi:protein-disulfide isomerase